MDTLEELLYYCNEPEPVGAFLLRISLFGLSSLEEVHAAVKQAWMEAYCKNKGMNDVTMERTKKEKSLLPN